MNLLVPGEITHGVPEKRIASPSIHGDGLLGGAYQRLELFHSIQRYLDSEPCLLDPSVLTSVKSSQTSS